jgi:hypothetical protein
MQIDRKDLRREIRSAALESLGGQISFVPGRSGESANERTGLLNQSGNNNNISQQEQQQQPPPPRQRRDAKRSRAER